MAPPAHRDDLALAFVEGMVERPIEIGDGFSRDCHRHDKLTPSPARHDIGGLPFIFRSFFQIKNRILIPHDPLLADSADGSEAHIRLLSKRPLISATRIAAPDGARLRGGQASHLRLAVPVSYANARVSASPDLRQDVRETANMLPRVRYFSALANC